jgi:hypothetical protein
LPSPTGIFRQRKRLRSGSAIWRGGATSNPFWEAFTFRTTSRGVDFIAESILKCIVKQIKTKKWKK